MNLVTGDMWDEIGRADLILFTANSTLDRNGHLIMGAGAALEAKRRCPEAPEVFGEQVAALGGRRYGLLFDPRLVIGGTQLAAFQVKEDWRKPASLGLIRHATLYLLRRAPCWKRVAINFPGTGAGRLKRADVLPILETLPDNVFVYEREEAR